MKKLFTLSCLLFSLNALSDDKYIPPSVLNPTEAKNAENALINNKIALFNHWKARIARAKLNNTKLSKSGIPLQKPYYGDSGAHH